MRKFLDAFPNVGGSRVHFVRSSDRNMGANCYEKIAEELPPRCDAKSFVKLRITRTENLWRIDKTVSAIRTMYCWCVKRKLLAGFFFLLANFSKSTPSISPRSNRTGKL